MRSCTTLFSGLALAGLIAFPARAAKADLTFGYVPPTPTCGTTFNVAPGETVEFDVLVVDTNPTHDIAWIAHTQPTGSTFTPAGPVVVFGNGIDVPTISAHFKWTPAPNQTGSFQVIWETANFPDAIRLVCGVTIEVRSFNYVPPTPECGSVIHATPGETIEFDVKVVDTDPTHVIAWAVVQQPPGSTFTPPSPIVVFGNGIDPPTITSHFKWTPAPDQIGSFDVIWDSANFPPAIRLFCSVTIVVGPLPPFSYRPPTPDCGSTIHAVPGQTVEFDIKLVDDDPTHVIAWAAIDQPAGSTFTPSGPIVVFGNGVDAPTILTHFKWTPGPNQTGTFQVLWDAANFPPAIRLFCSVTIEVALPLTSCSSTQSGWGASPQGNNVGMLLRNHFASVYPSGVEIGIPGSGGESAKFASSDAIESFLPTGGTPGVLSGDSVDPGGATSAGMFAGQVLALQLNVDFGDAGLMTGNGTPFSSLTLKRTNIPGLDGQTVAQVLAAANLTLGGGGASYGLSTSDLNDLVTKLNESFDNCNEDVWAHEHLD